jgi:hypothetical protein
MLLAFDVNLNEIWYGSFLKKFGMRQNVTAPLDEVWLHVQSSHTDK